jgi:hypothetical protein
MVHKHVKLPVSRLKEFLKDENEGAAKYHWAYWTTGNRVFLKMAHDEELHFRNIMKMINPKERLRRI